MHELALLKSQMDRYADIEQNLVAARAELVDVREQQGMCFLLPTPFPPLLASNPAF